MLELSDLGMGLVYFSQCDPTKFLATGPIKKLSIYRSLTENEREELEDVEIEADQLVAMANLSDQIFRPGLGDL